MGRGRADLKGSCEVEYFLVPTTARVWGQELPWCVTAAPGSEDSSVGSVSFLDKSKRWWLSWSDLKLLAVVFSSTTRMQMVCGDNLHYTSKAFRLFWHARSLGKIWMLVYWLNGLFELSTLYKKVVNISEYLIQVRQGKKKRQRISLALFWRVHVPSPNPEVSAHWSAAWIGASFRGWLCIAMTCDVQLHLAVCWIKQLKNVIAFPSPCLQVNDSEQKNKLLLAWSTVFLFGPHSICSNVAVFPLFLFLFFFPLMPSFWIQ